MMIFQKDEDEWELLLQLLFFYAILVCSLETNEMKSTHKIEMTDGSRKLTLKNNEY